MAVTDNYKVVVDTAQAQQSLTRLQSKLGDTNKVFGGLKGVLAGVGLAAFGRTAMQTADEIKDLSTVTNIAIGRIQEFRMAMALSGGNAGESTKALTTFTKSIDEAAQGSLKAQNSFAELGISLVDLQTLSTEALLVKTVEGLSKLSDKTRVAALSTDKFGQSFRTVDTAGLLESLRSLSGSGDKYAQSITRATELNDKFAKAQERVKLAFLETFSPAIDKINKAGESIEDGEGKMTKLVNTIRIAGVAVAATFAVSIGYGIAKVIGMLGRGVVAAGSLAGRLGFTGAVAARLGTAASNAAKSGIFRAAGPHMNALRAIIVLISGIGGAIASASLLFEDFGDMVGNVAAWVIEEIGLIGASILNLPTDAIAAFLNLFGADIKDPVGLGTGLENLVEKARAARKEFEDAVKAKKEAAKSVSESGSTTGNGEEDRVIDTTELDKARQRAKEIGDEFKRNNATILEQIALDSKLIGKSKEQADIIRAQAELTNRTKDAVQQLTDAKANLSVEEKKAGLAGEYDKQIARVKALSAAEQSRLQNAVTAQNTLLNAEQKRLFGIQQEIDSNKRIQKIQDDMAVATLPAIQKRYKEIENAARDVANAEIDAEEARRNAKLTEAEKNEYREFANLRIAEEKRVAKSAYDQSRSFSTGWNQAYIEYVENATNAANHARNIFGAVTQGMEDMIIDFVKTGRANFNEFINSIVEMLLRSEIQRLFARVATGGGAGAAGSFFSGLTGFAGGGIVGGNKPVLVGERGPEVFMPPGAGSIVPNGALGGSTQVTYQINAVDARSFQQLVASDPEFLYAVTQKGQRSLGGR